MVAPEIVSHERFVPINPRRCKSAILSSALLEVVSAEAVDFGAGLELILDLDW